MNTGIKFSDGHNLLVFLNSGRVVAYINLLRGVADFRGTINHNQLFTRDNSIFFVFSAESVWGWDGAQLAHWNQPTDEWLPLISERWREIADSMRENNENSEWVLVEPLTDPWDLARHELSRVLFPFAPASRILGTAPYNNGVLPAYIEVEIVSLSLFQSENPPDFPNESIGNMNYSTDELLGFYTGAIFYQRSHAEYMGQGWWAVESFWEGRLYLLTE